MNHRSKLSRVMVNTGAGLLCKGLLMIMAFLKRSCFIYLLNEDYLGINGLYANILQVLSLANLGFDTVLMYFLYEPVVTDNQQRIRELIAAFRKIFYSVSLIIGLAGILLIPFLPYIIQGSGLQNRELITYYVLFLADTCLSYLGVYKSVLLRADQCSYLTTFIDFISTAANNIFSIIILFITHSYIAFLLIMISSTIFRNVMLTAITNHRYPFIKNLSGITCNYREIRIKMGSTIKAAFIYRLSITLMNSTDYILISAIVSTAAVGYYSNYVLITANLLILINMFSGALMASLGNFNVNALPHEKEQMFRTIELVYYGIGTFVMSCLITMMNDFMRVWISDPGYILPQSFVVVLAIKVLVDIIIRPNQIFREAAGVFREVKFVVLVAAILNIGLSIVFGKRLGLTGILLATIVSQLVTLFWYEPKVFYRKFFENSVGRYWNYQVKLGMSLLAANAVSYVLTDRLPGGITGCCLKILVSGVCSLVAFLPMILWSPEGKYLRGHLSAFLLRTQNGNRS